MSKKVYQYTKDGKFASSHKSVTKASNIMGCDESTIRKVVDTDRTAMGFYWRGYKSFTNGVTTINLPKILILDIETAPLKAFVWQTQVWKANISNNMVLSEWFAISWAAKLLDEDTVMSDVLTSKEAKKEDDKRIIFSLWTLINEADIVIAHNGIHFDVPNINTRFLLNGLPPTKPYKQIDTLQVARKQFGFTHNSLNALAKLFGVTEKIDTNFDLWARCVDGDDSALKEMETYNIQDVKTLESVYLKLRPWIRSHPNVGIYSTENQHICSNCGSTDLSPNGFNYTQVGKYQVYKCNKCGALSQESRTLLDIEKRKTLLKSLGK
jgi:DNA polymerase III epsilon subunit-like protein